jgi:hypothetical protein
MNRPHQIKNSRLKIKNSSENFREFGLLVIHVIILLVIQTSREPLLNYFFIQPRLQETNLRKLCHLWKGAIEPFTKYVTLVGVGGCLIRSQTV